MIQGQLCEQEVAKAGVNVLNEFANFDKVHVWNIASGEGNAVILNNVSGRVSYFGIGAVSINFTGTSEVTFNSGGTDLRRVIQRTGRYILSYCFQKSDDNSDINFAVEMFVNDVLQPNNIIEQNLYTSSGFVDGQWNRYYQVVDLEYGDVIDFRFRAQSDTTACYLYFDGLMLQLDDRGGGYPTIYAPADLDRIEEENILTIPTIPHNETAVITASLTGGRINNGHYVNIIAPPEVYTAGLVVGVPSLVSDNVVKFTLHNQTGASVTLPEDLVFNFKVFRQ